MASDNNLVDILNDVHEQHSSGQYVSSMYYDIPEFSSFISNVESNKHLSVLNTNARSLARHVSDYQLLLEAVYESVCFQFDIITFTETWLNSDLEDLVSLNNYRPVFQHKANKKEGGGLAIFVKEGLSYIIRSDINIPVEFRDKFDVLFVEILMGNTSNNFIIGLVYRSPNSNESDFVANINAILNQLENEHKNLIILGDMNIDLLRMDTHTNSNLYFSSFISNGFIPAVTLPTRVTHTSCTLIDHIFAKLKNHTFKAGSLTTDITDHFTNFILCPIKVTKEKVKHVSYRNFSETNIQHLQTALANHDWSLVTSISDVDRCYSKFLEIFQEKFENYIPLITRKFNKYQHKTEPWITKALLQSMKTRDKMHCRMMKIENPLARQTAEYEYKRFRNMLNQLIKLSKKNYWNTVLGNYNKDVKTTWNHINQMLGKSRKQFDFPSTFHYNNVTLSTPLEIANGFNSFYINIGPNLARNLPSSTHSFRNYLSQSNSADSFFMQPSNEHEIKTIVKAMKCKTSSGFDSISPKLLQGTIVGISSPLTHVINLSLEKGEVPNLMKLAKVIPVHKGGETSSIVNYRPISLLPTFSKVLERVVYKRLLHFLKQHKVLTPSQYGFQASLSTELAILELQDRIASALSCGSWCLGVFLDLSKAFDTINHNILLSKLESYGIRGLALSWFKSYLTNRKQYTFVKNANSDTRLISCGVPQGSILGPLLFLVYVNDIRNVVENGCPILFADDTNILYTHNNLTALCHIANLELERISQWFTLNKLSVNTSKTKVIVFHRRHMQYQPTDIQISLNNTTLEKVSSLKFLGVYIHENLSWKMHVDHICKKISKSLGMLYRLKHQLPEYILLQLYNSLVLSHVNYCISVWGNVSEADKKRIFVLQKKALRCISNSPYNCHTNPLFVKYNLMKFNDIYRVSCCKLYFHFKKGTLPIFHASKFNIQSQRNINTRQSHDISSPLIRYEVGKNCLVPKVAEAWNSLPLQLKTCMKSLNTFKKIIKSHYINTYNIPCNIPNCRPCQRQTTNTQ